jgi:hypothetical protein
MPGMELADSMAQHIESLDKRVGAGSVLVPGGQFVQHGKWSQVNLSGGNDEKQTLFVHGYCRLDSITFFRLGLGCQGL